MPFFSIIIPTYNSAKKLSGAIDSILKQTFKDFEILIIDGASTDSTIGIVESYRDKRIKIFSEHDKGIYDAMNKGIKYANGSWLYFLGSDDKLYNEKILEKIIAFLHKNDYDVVYGNVISSRFDGIYDGEFSYKKLYAKNICHQSILFKKSVFGRIGVFNLSYPVLADWANNIKWMLNKHVSKGFINELVAVYANGGISSTTKDPRFTEMKNLLFIKSGFFTLDISFLKKLIAREYRRRTGITSFFFLFLLILLRLKLKLRTLICQKYQL